MRVISVVCLVLLTACKFHEVDAGKFYRSHQPSGPELQRAIDEVGIRTVINLRGPNPGAKWYDDEKEVTLRNNVLQVDIGLSASRLPHREQMIQILDTLKNAPRPILVHCRAGVDRTGEVSAIYQMLYMNKTKAEALEMLTPKYGHVASWMPAPTYLIRELWQGEEWARTSYNPCSGAYAHYNIKDSACAPATEVPPSDPATAPAADPASGQANGDT
jgi:hypothetical protein